MTTKPKNEMSFLEHLEELRWLLVRSTIAILIASLFAFFISDFIIEQVIFGPVKTDFITYQIFCELSQKMGVEADFCIKEFPFKIQNTNVGGQFSFLIWICLIAGFILSFPYVLWQIWRFIQPALYKNEQKNAVLFIVSTTILFFIGILFGYYLIVPLSVHFFGTFNVSNTILNEFNLESYIGMIKTSVIACGLLFELPIIIYFLSKVGLVTPAFLRKHRKYAIVIVLILAAIITPPDVLSQMIVTIPIMIIYEASILISVFVEKRETKI